MLVSDIEEFDTKSFVACAQVRKKYWRRPEAVMMFSTQALKRLRETSLRSGASTANITNIICSQIFNSQTLERRYRAIVFFASFIAHIPFLFGRYLPRESLKYFSADENALIRVILRYQEHLTTFDLASLLSERLEYGYGYLYYLSYSILTYPFATMAGDEGVLAAGRFISAVFESATVVLVCMIARQLRVHTYVVILVGLATAFTTGMIVIHKPLSAEQLSNFLIVGAAWAALAMPRQGFRANLFLISALVGAAISVKFNAALEGLFFALIVLVRIYQQRSDLLATARNYGQIIRTVATDFAVLAAGLFTFFFWNLPIVILQESRNVFINWLNVQYQSNQNSQKGKLDYRGIGDWWPKVDQYFGDNNLLPWLIMSAAVAGVAGLFVKNSKSITLYSLLILLWVLVPAAYVLLTVRKVWLWYLTMPGFFLLLGPACLYAIGTQLHKAGSNRVGAFVGFSAIFLLLAHLWTAIPDYAAFSNERWRETKRPDFLEMEEMRLELTREISGKLGQTTMIVDQRTTLPNDYWRANGARIHVRYLPTIDAALISEIRPQYIVIRYWGYAHHRGNRKRALAEFQEKLNASCKSSNACYKLFKDYSLSKTQIYKIQGG